MSLSVNDLVVRAGQLARRGASEADTGIWDDNIWRLVPDAMQRLAQMVARDPEKRGMLVKLYGCAMLQGRCDLAGAPFDSILHETLQFARFYDPTDDADQLYPYIWKANPAELKGYLHPSFGYFTVDRNQIYTRQRGNANLPTALVALDGINAVLHTVYVPDGGPLPIPTEIGGDAVQVLAAMAAADVKSIVATLAK